MEMKESNKQFDDVKSSIHTEALKLADDLLHSEVMILELEASRMIHRLVEELDKAQQDLNKYDKLAWDDLANLTPCEELRRFQDVQNSVFSVHNACCYREDCRTVWNDWEKVRSSMMPLSDEEIIEELKLLPQLISMEDKDFIEFARAIEERHGIK